MIEIKNGKAYNKETKKDVSDKLTGLLFYPVEIKNTSLFELAGLIAENPALYDIFPEQYMEEVVERILQSPEVEQNFTALTVTPSLSINQDTNTLTSFMDMDVNIISKDGFEDSPPQPYGLTLTDISNFIHAEIIINTLAKTMVTSDSVLAYNTPIAPIFRFDNISLGQLLYSIFYEISFYGSPEDKDDMQDMIIDSLNKFHAAQESKEAFQEAVVNYESNHPDNKFSNIITKIVKETSLDDIADDVIDDDRDESLDFESTDFTTLAKGVIIVDERLTPRVIDTFLSSLTPELDMMDIINIAFGERVKLKEEFIGLNCSEYQAKCYELDLVAKYSKEVEDLKKQGLTLLEYKKQYDYEALELFASHADIDEERLMKIKQLIEKN